MPGDIDFKRFFDLSRSPHVVLDPDFRVIAANPAYAQLAGRPLEDLLGRDVISLYPDSPDRNSAGPNAIRAHWEQVVATGRAASLPLQRYDLLDPETGAFTERHWAMTTVPDVSDDGEILALVVHVEEVTSVAADKRPASSVSDESDNRDVFEITMDRLAGIADLAKDLSRAETLSEVATTWLTSGVQMLGADGGALMVLHRGQWSILSSENLTANTTAKWRTFELQAGREPFSDAVEFGEMMLFSGIDEMTDRYPGLAETLELSGHQSWAVVPLHGGSPTIGAAGIAYKDVIVFTDSLRSSLRAVADLVGQAASRTQLMEELNQMVTSVEAAFPTPLVDADSGVVAVSGVYESASHQTMAGGDWYEVRRLANGDVLIVIADAARHGPAAAGDAARTRALIHYLANTGMDPASIARAASTEIEATGGDYVTAIIARYQPSTRTLTWTTAGHPPPLFFDDGSDPVYLDQVHGLPLGIDLELTAPYGSSSRECSAGDCLLLYTDGLVETRDRPIDWGLEQLLASARRHGPTAELPKLVWNDLHPAGVRFDDMAAVIVSFM